MFYDKFIAQCNNINKSPSAAAEDMGFHRSEVSRWAKGVKPRRATLLKMAAYFGCDVSDLSGEEKKEPAPLDGLSEKETEFITKLRCASAEIQQAVWAVLKSADEKEK